MTASLCGTVVIDQTIERVPGEKGLPPRRRRGRAGAKAEEVAAVTKYLIWSLEHDAWWAPDERGYVRTAGEAGRYEKPRAEEICEKANKYLPSGVMHEVAIPEKAL